MRRAGKAAAATLAHVAGRLAAGIATADIDAWVREDTARRGGKPSQLGFHGFPAAVCTSRNDVVCHGVPRADERLQPGDIVNVDVTTLLDGRPEVKLLADGWTVVTADGSLSAQFEHTIVVTRGGCEVMTG